MNTEQPSPSRSPGRDSDRSILTDEHETPPAMSIIDVVTAVESGEFDLHDTASIGLTPFYRVCLTDNHNTSYGNR